MTIESIIAMVIGSVILGIGVFIGYCLSMYSYKKGALVVDNIYHDKAPFDEVLRNEEPLDSHVDGVNRDEV